jgi:hypothetical protein
MRRGLWLAVFAVALHWQSGFAQQLVLPELTPAGKKIVSTITDLPAGAKVAYLADATGDVAKRNGTEAYWWGATGWHDAVAVVFSEGEDEPQWLRARYRVGEAPPPGPDPPPATLRDLAGKDAASLANIYRQLFADVARGGYSSVGEFHKTHEILLADLGLAANGAAAEIAKRLDVPTLPALKTALEKIVAELGSSPKPPGPLPPTPPPPAGKRHVVIVRESENDTPDMAFLFNALRTDEPSKWLKEQGHTLAIHDDDDEDQNGQPIPLVEKLEQLGPVPGLFVLDQTSGIVVHKQELPRTAPEVIDVVKAH